jgi:hypothetical protein
MYKFFIDAKQNNTYQYEFRFDNKKGDKEWRQRLLRLLLKM